MDFNFILLHLFSQSDEKEISQSTRVRAEKSASTTTNTEEPENITSNTIHIGTVSEAEVNNASINIVVYPSEESCINFR